MRHRHIDRAAGFGGGGLEGAAQHQRQALRGARFPGDFGELAADIFLVETGTRAKAYFVAPLLVIVQAGGDHERAAVAAGIVELASHLRSAGDHVHIHEGGFAAHAMIAIGHCDHDAFVESHDQLDAGIVDDGVKESDFEGAGIGEQVLRACGFRLRYDECAA